MKKNILICIALMATIIAGAQETNRGATTAPTPLYRVGEMYCYGETTMDKKAYLLLTLAVKVDGFYNILKINYL